MRMHETDWEALGQTWRASGETSDATPLRKIVRSEGRKLMFVAVAEVAMGIALAVLSAFVMADGVARWEAIWLITLWSFAAIASAFAIWNRRGIWTAAGESVAEYVRITRLRAQRQMRSIYFASGFFVAEVVVVVVQLAWFDRLTFLATLLLTASGAAMAIWCWTTKKKIARDLHALKEYGE